MTDIERELEEQRKEIQYLFSWFRSRCGTAEEWCGDIDRENYTRLIGGKIRDMKRMIVKLREEWDKFLKLKRKVKL